MEKINKTTKILLGLLAVSILIFIGFHLLEEKEIYELSREMVKEGEYYYQKKEYKKAKLFFDRALKRYNDLIVLRFLKSEEIKQLENRLKTDPILQKVAQGYIYYNGKWVNEKELEALMKEKRRLKQKINIYLKTAKFFGSIEDIENNIRVYQKALKEIEESPFNNEQDIKQLKKKLKEKLVFLTEEAIKKYKEKGNLKKLAHYYRILLKYKPSHEAKKELFQTYLKLYQNYINDGEYIKALSVLLKAKELGIETETLLPKIEYVVSQIEVEDLKNKDIKDAYVYYILAKKSFSRFDIVEAQQLLEQSLKLEPDNIHAKLLYAKILLSTGDVEKAKKLVEEVLQKQPDNAEGILLAGDIYLKLGETEKAVSYYEKAKETAQVKDKLFKAYKKLGLTYYESKNLQKAKEYLLKAVSIKDDPEVYRTLGDIYYQEGEIEKAEKNYLTALKLKPELKKELSRKIGKIYTLKGDNYFSRKAYRKAINEYKKALRYLGSRQELLKKIAQSYEKLGDAKTALYYYKKLGSAKVKQKEADLYVKLGKDAYSKGSYFTALKYFNKALEINPSVKEKLKNYITNAYVKIGKRYLAEGNYIKAINYFQKAVKIDSSLFNKIKNEIFQAYKKYGVQMYRQKNYKTALQYLKKAESIKKDDLETVYYLGKVYMKLGRLKEALEQFERYTARRTDNKDVIKDIAIIYAKQGDIKKAKRYAEQLLKEGKYRGFANFIIGKYYYLYEKQPEKALSYFLKAENNGYKSGDLYYFIGKIYYDKGNYLRAITYLTEAINKGYKNEDVYYRRALSYLKLKDYRKAINDLSMVIKHNPNDGKAYFLRGKLYYEHGNYVKGEYKKAIEDLEKAAAMGIKEAEKLLTEARTKK